MMYSVKKFEKSLTDGFHETKYFFYRSVKMAATSDDIIDTPSKLFDLVRLRTALVDYIQRPAEDHHKMEYESAKVKTTELRNILTNLGYSPSLIQRVLVDREYAIFLIRTISNN